MQRIHLLRALALGSLVVGLGVAGCNKNGYGNSGYGSTPANDNSAATVPDNTNTMERNRAAEETNPTGAGASATNPNHFEETRDDKADAQVAQLTVQQDKIYDEVYRSYAQQTGEKLEDNVPAMFKSHCKSAGQGESVLGTDKTQAFFAQASVKSKCAEITSLQQRIDAIQDRH